MNKRFLTIVFFFVCVKVNAQVEVSVPFVSHGKQYLLGSGIRVGKTFFEERKISTSTYIGGLWMWKYNKFIDGDFRSNIYQLTQQINYKLVSNKKYKLIPSIGINYNIIKWKGKLNPPYDQLPIRSSYTEFGRGSLVLHSTSSQYQSTYSENGFGLIGMISNHFKINDKLWFTISPFYGDTFSGGQNHGGCYFGMLFKNL